MPYDQGKKRGKVGRVVLLVVLAAVGFFLWWELSGEPPQIRLSREIKGIGRSTPVSFAVKDRRGLITLRVELEQGGQTIPVLSESYEIGRAHV